ncbi:MAG: PhnD/SsuA/transferrin family substrate-binding protein [Acidimicrobiia bacterium]
MRLRNLLILFFVLAMVAAACGDSADTTTAATDAPTATEPDPKADWPDKIVFGFIPSERQESLQTDIQPIMDALEATIGIEVEGIVTADYNGLVVALGTGQVDFGAFGPLGFVQAQEQYPGVELLLQSVRFGSATYHGQWYTNDPTICEDEPRVGAFENIEGVPTIVDPADASAQQVGWDDEGDVTNAIPQTLEDGTVIEKGLVCTASLESARGRDVAFGSSTSTSASVFPQLMLKALGFDIETDINYAYLGGHSDAVLSVYTGDFDIGASFDDARRGLASGDSLPDVGTKVITFGITGEIPNDVVAVLSELPDNLKDAVFDAIELYLETQEGKDQFDLVYGWTAIQKADDSAFDFVRSVAEGL